jgi:hypothetical protein
MIIVSTSSSGQNWSIHRIVLRRHCWKLLRSWFCNYKCLFSSVVAFLRCAVSVRSIHRSKPGRCHSSVFKIELFACSTRLLLYSFDERTESESSVGIFFRRYSVRTGVSELLHLRRLQRVLFDYFFVIESCTAVQCNCFWFFDLP